MDYICLYSVRMAYVLGYIVRDLMGYVYIYIRILVGFKRIYNGINNYTRIYLCVCTYEKYMCIYIYMINKAHLWNIPNFA